VNAETSLNMASFEADPLEDVGQLLVSFGPRPFRRRGEVFDREGAIGGPAHAGLLVLRLLHSSDRWRYRENESLDRLGERLAADRAERVTSPSLAGGW
jgi:hypothetical protein